MLASCGRISRTSTSTPSRFQVRASQRVHELITAWVPSIKATPIRTMADVHRAQLPMSISPFGSPAAMGRRIRPTGPWLCVPGFPRGCRFRLVCFDGAVDTKPPDLEQEIRGLHVPRHGYSAHRERPWMAAGPAGRRSEYEADPALPVGEVN